MILRVLSKLLSNTLETCPTDIESSLLAMSCGYAFFVTATPRKGTSDVLLRTTLFTSVASERSFAYPANCFLRSSVSLVEGLT